MFVSDLLIKARLKDIHSPNNTEMYLFAQKFKPSKVLMVGDGGFSVGEFLKIDPVKLFE